MSEANRLAQSRDPESELGFPESISLPRRSPTIESFSHASTYRLVIARDGTLCKRPIRQRLRHKAFGPDRDSFPIRRGDQAANHGSGRLDQSRARQDSESRLSHRGRTSATSGRSNREAVGLGNWRRRSGRGRQRRPDPRSSRRRCRQEVEVQAVHQGRQTCQSLH